MDLTIYWTAFAENELQNIFEYYCEEANFKVAKKLVDGIYDATSIDELINRLIFMEKVEAGIKQSEQGKVVSNEDVKLIIEKTEKSSSNGTKHNKVMNCVFL